MALRFLSLSLYGDIMAIFASIGALVVAALLFVGFLRVLQTIRFTDPKDDPKKD